MIAVIGGRYAGSAEYAKTMFPNHTIITGYEEKIRQEIKEGIDPCAQAERDAQQMEPDTVIVLTEMGCGIVPADREDRRFREENGRVNCIFAGHAQQVIRVIAGIGQRIK